MSEQKFAGSRVRYLLGRLLMSVEAKTDKIARCCTMAFSFRQVRAPGGM